MSAPRAPREPGAQVEPTRRALLVGALRASALCPALAACEYIALEETGGDTSLSLNTHDPRFAALNEAGGHACVRVGGYDMIVLRVSDAEMIAFEQTCPHQALPLVECGPDALAMWDPEAQQLTCPWHESVFGRDGAVVSGPAPRRLFVVPVAFDPATGTATVDLAKRA